ncbi:MAG: YqhA family protein [Candidatus Loosdrechtia sp.]|uniref:YqhA family protein n=1 Tax=Candidatus Loosdrechtia sp. TaxID=3101272 RepID=UPI003A61AD11|nr:MAG: YqhA family protein [Candidatus Jettenia sp. AMX2]
MEKLSLIRTINRLLIIIGRFFIAIASISIILASGFLIVTGLWDLVNGLPGLVGFLVHREELLMDVSVRFIAVVDAFLVAVVMYVLGIGLYRVFIDDRLASDHPEWFAIHDLYDLKDKLIATSVVILLMTFVKKIVTWENPKETLYFGFAIALVIAAVTLFSRLIIKKEKTKE